MQKKHHVCALIFIASVCVAWFWAHKKQDYYEEIVLNFTDSELPGVDVSIEGVQHPMVIDLGSCLEMHMKSEVLQHLSRSLVGTEKWKNFRGTEFTRANYKLLEAKIGSLVFKNPVATEEFFEEEDCIVCHDPNHQKKSPKAVGF